ncbi:MAG: exopolysaccharide biosynthesis protein, partial [Rhodobacteraceae bacterium]|nr:exopolysaccharide biosynthesis protein [Paracoccaceae bacterium]
QRPEGAWTQLPCVARAPGLPGAGDEAVERSFVLLRTRLLKQLRAHAWSRVALAAPTAGCGTTFSAINLARSFGAVPGLRTVLMDLNLQRPGIGRALRLSGRDDMRAFLTGRLPPDDHLMRLSDTLAVGLAREGFEASAGLLHSETCAYAIGSVMDSLHPDVLLCDLPPILERDDLAAFLPQVDGVVLIADATRTRPEHIAECERMLEGQTRVLGVVLNLARRTGPVPAHA